MAKQRVNCPFCFEQIKVSDIGFRCDSSMCGGKPVSREISFLEKIGFSSTPKRIFHADCNQHATTRICPKCAGVLPTAIDDLSDLSIAVIGAKESGKSHYVALLIHRIKQLYAEFGWNLTALDEETMERYRSRFYDPLFRKHETIGTTASAKGGAKPLLYSLRFGKRGGLSKRVMLVFFDAAGEDLENGDNMKYISRYIYNASGIICLLDPLQLRKVREGVAAKCGSASLPQLNGDTGTIINRVANLIHSNRATGNQRIKIPLAVAFSKMDAVRDAGENAEEISNLLYQETRHRGVFNYPEFTTIDTTMQSWVQEVDDTSDILSQGREFEYLGFFGFSALGCNPQATQKLDQDPRPVRVEDPFLWILFQHALIPVKKG